MDDASSDSWQILDEEKYYDIDGHLIYILSSENGEDITPDGYRYLSSEFISRKRNIKMHFFVNNVPVIANLCYNEKNDELCFYFPGKIITEKTKTYVKSK